MPAVKLWRTERAGGERKDLRSRVISVARPPRALQTFDGRPFCVGLLRRNARRSRDLIYLVELEVGLEPAVIATRNTFRHTCLEGACQQRSAHQPTRLLA